LFVGAADNLFALQPGLPLPLTLIGKGRGHCHWIDKTEQGINGRVFEFTLIHQAEGLTLTSHRILGA